MTIINELRLEYPIKLLITISNVPKSTYYYNTKKVDKDIKNKALMTLINEIFVYHKGRYGYRRITLYLKNKGYLINHKKVKRLMKEMNLYGFNPKIKYKSYKGDLNGTCKNYLLEKKIDKEAHQTIYERDFKTTKANEKWATDVTEFHIAAGKLYFSPIIDIHTRDIVSYNISTSPNFKQTRDMLDKAFSKYHDLNNLIFHSDQGWQYQMSDYQTRLNSKGIIQSMSRKGNCLDNSPMENFFGIMKNEMFYGHENQFESLDQLKIAINEYIDYYNNERISTKLKGLTPVQFRNQSLQT